MQNKIKLPLQPHIILKRQLCYGEKTILPQNLSALPFFSKDKFAITLL